MYTRTFVLSFLLLVLGAGLTVEATTLAKVRERRKARLSDVQKLIKSGKATEGEDGYLKAGKELDNKKIVFLQEENQDRKTGYEAIAKNNGKKVAEIGKKAGEINRKRAAKLQTE